MCLMDNFDKNIFINCPFDDEYRELLLPIIFTVKYLGYIPQLALEQFDSGISRIDKIVNLIQKSKFGIHDLSRIISTQENEYFRMNMPFELGIDFAYQRLDDPKYSHKKLLILEKERYRFQKSLSDLSGSDIKNHNNDPMTVIRIIRDWFIPEEIQRGASGNSIWTSYNDFHAYLYEEAVKKDGHSSYDAIAISEIMHHMSTWLKIQNK